MPLNKRLIKKNIHQIKTIISSKTAAFLHTKESPGQKMLPKTDIFIWGCNEFSIYLYHLLTRNNVNVIAFIESNTEITSFCSKPVYDPKAFKTKPEYSSISIVIASPRNMESSVPSIDFESIRQFKLKLLEIIHDHEISNPLLHPSVMVDGSNCKYPNKIIAFGIPGAGNTIYNHIFIKLIEAYNKKFKTQNNDAFFFEKLCFEYEQCIKQALSDAIYAIDGHYIMLVPWNIGSSMMVFTHENKESFLYTFQTRDHITHRAFGYHNIPGINSLDKAITDKFKLFLVVRNPLDNIISILKKRNRIDKHNKQIDPDAFCNVSHKVLHEMVHLSHYLSKLEILRYEDLMQKPVQQISNVMHKLGIVPSKSLATKIWSQLGFKQLPHASKGHFTGGGSGKWETYFKSEHLAFLSMMGIESLLEQYGYHDMLETFKYKMQSISPDEWRRKLIKPENTYDFSTRDESQYELQVLKSMHGEENLVKCGSLYIASDNPELVKKLQCAFNNGYIQKLIAAGAPLQNDYPQLKTVCQADKG